METVGGPTDSSKAILKGRGCKNGKKSNSHFCGLDFVILNKNLVYIYILLS
jgi:hypothetical protein